MTCVNYLKLPDYSCRSSHSLAVLSLIHIASAREIVKARVATAVQEGAGGFHLSESLAAVSRPRLTLVPQVNTLRASSYSIFLSTLFFCTECSLLRMSTLSFCNSILFPSPLHRLTNPRKVNKIRFPNFAAFPRTVCAAMATRRRAAYVHSAELVAAADKLPSNEGRASLVHSLVEAFELLEEASGNAADGAVIIEAVAATREELCSYHDEGELQSRKIPSTEL